MAASSMPISTKIVFELVTRKSSETYFWNPTEDATSLTYPGVTFVRMKFPPVSLEAPFWGSFSIMILVKGSGSLFLWLKTLPLMVPDWENPFPGKENANKSKLIRKEENILFIKVQKNNLLSFFIWTNYIKDEISKKILQSHNVTDSQNLAICTIVTIGVKKILQKQLQQTNSSQ